MVSNRRQPISAAQPVVRPRGTSYLFALGDGLPDLPQFRPILDLYEAKQAGRLLPAWRDFEFRDLKGWHANFALYEFDEDAEHGVCKLMGEQYRAGFQAAVRPGMALDTVEEPIRPQLLSYLRTLLKGPDAGYFTGHLSYAGREHVELDVLDLPAADRDGKARYLMSFVCPPAH